MSFSAERRVIETAFKQGWGNNTTPVLYENTNQKIPTANFVYFRIVGSDGRQAEICGNESTLIRYTGIVQVDVIAKIDSGTDDSKKLADLVTQIFARKQFTDADAGTITFKIPSVRTMGTTDGRYRTVITCPFIRDIKE